MDPINANATLVVAPHTLTLTTSEQRLVIQKIIQESKDLPRVDQAILLAIGDLESRFDVKAKNPSSSAYGIFQIIDKTWTGLGYSSRSRNSESSQISAGLKLFRQNNAILMKKNIEALTPEQKAIEIYVLHHDGPSGKDFGGRKVAEKQIVPRFRAYFAELARMDS